MAQPLTVSDLEMRLGETRRLIAEKWGWFLALGIVLILAGLAAIAFPLLGTIAVKIMLGWLFLIGGVVMIVHAFQAPGWQGFLWELLIGILYVVAGAYLAFFPLTGLLTLAILLAVLFIAEGVFEVIHGLPGTPARGLGLPALERHRRPRRRRAYRTGRCRARPTWALGLLVGINLLFSGWSYVFLALAGRRAHEAAAATR